MAILSNANVDKQKKRFNSMIRVMAFNLVDEHLTNVGAVITKTEQDELIKKEEQELRVLFKTNKEEFNNYLNSYFHKIHGQSITLLAPELQQLLIEEGAVTSKGNISANAASHVKSGLGKLHKRASAHDIGIDIKPTTTPKRGIADVFKPRYYDPNTSKTTEENKQIVLDKKGFAEDNKYRALILSEEKRILDKKHLATEEEIRLIKAIKETKKDWDKKVNTKENYEAILTPAEKGLVEVIDTAKSGLSSIWKLIKPKSNVPPPVVPAPVVPAPVVPPAAPISAPSYIFDSPDIVDDLDSSDSALKEEKDETSDELIEADIESKEKNYEILEKIDEDIKTLQDTSDTSSLGDTISAGIAASLASKLPAILKTGLSGASVILSTPFITAAAGIASTVGILALMIKGEKEYREHGIKESKEARVAVGSESDSPSFFEVLTGDRKSHDIRQGEANKKYSQFQGTAYYDNGWKDWDTGKEVTYREAANAHEKKKLEVQHKNDAAELETQGKITEKNKDIAKTENLANAVSTAVSQNNQQLTQNISAISSKGAGQKDSPRNPDNSITLFLNTRAKFA